MKARLPQGFGGGQQNMNSMIKQAQKVQEDMQKTQAELEEKTFDITSGGGACKVTITGKREIQKIELSPEIVDPEDIEMLQDTLVAAVNEAIRKVNETSDAEMAKVTGGFSMPGLF